MSSVTTMGPEARREDTAQPSRVIILSVWIAVAIGGAAFIALAYTAHVVAYFPLDLALTRAIQGIPLPWFHALMVAVSWPGFPPQVYILVVLIAIGFYAAHRRREAWYLVASSVAIAIISQGVKLLVDRPRPSPSLVHVLLPGLNGGHWSFPAGHVESYMVIFGFIIFVVVTEWRANLARAAVTIFSLLMMALIGVSRIDSGEHWFSDALGGYLLGSLVLLVILVWFQRGCAHPR